MGNHIERDGLEGALMAARSISTSANDAIITINPRSEILSWNPAAARIFGYAENEAIGETIHLIIAEHLHQAHDDGVARVAAGEASRIIGETVEVEGRRKNGEVFPVELSVATWIGEDGHYFSGILRDITDRKQTQEALRESEARYVLVNQATRDFLFDWNFKTDKVYFPIDKRAEFKQVDWDGSGVGWEERVHPDDREKFREHFIASLKGEVERISVEYRHRNDDGDWRWIHSKGLALRDLDGRAARLVGSMVDITDRKRAEMELMEAKREAELNAELLNATFESLDQGIAVVDADMQVLRCNPRWAELLDLPAAFVTDPPHLREVFRIQLERGEHTQIDGDIEERLAKLLATPEGSNNPTIEERETAAGRVLEVRTNSLTSGGRVRTFTDITERKLAEAEVLASKNVAFSAQTQMIDAIESTSEGFSLYDPEGRLILCNSAFRKIYDYSEADVANRPNVSELLALDIERGTVGKEAGGIDVTRHREEQFGHGEETLYLPLPDGRWVQIRDRRTADGGTVSVHTDITERKRTEEALENAKRDAEEANRAKSAFLASMSHEIRTPLSGITGFLELLQFGELDQDQHQMVQSANLAARALIDLIGDVLDFSKIEAGHLDLTSELVSPRHMLAETLAVVTPRAREKLVELLGQVAPEVPDQVHADPVRLRQILVNLVGNAVKFTESGAVHVELMVSRSHDDGAARLRFEIIDTGIGFDLGSTPDLFAEFRQADDTTTRRFGGTGLGLTICKRLIDLMGGEIGYHGEEGRGALFWFDLPITESEAPQGMAADEGGLKILLHDGEQNADREIFDLLSASGAQIHSRDETSASGDNNSLGGPYDALVMLDGESNRGVDTVRDVPETRILVAPETDFNLKQRALRAGFTHVLRRDRCARTLMLQIAEARWLLRASTATQSSKPISMEIKDTLDPEIADLPILVIDDIEMNRDIAGRQLRRLGLRHETAPDGRDGLAVATSRSFAAVLVDISMPIMDGFEFTRRLRDWENRQGATLARRLPVIALTASVTTGDAERCIAAGMDDYLAKPLTFGRLSDMLGKWLGAADLLGDEDRKARTTSTGSGLPPIEGSMPTLSDTPVDRENLHEIYGVLENGDLVEIIAQFFQNYERLQQRFDRAIESQDRDELHDVAHAAKGAAGYISSNKLGELFTAIEESASTAQWVHVQESMKLIEDELGKIRSFAETLEREG